ncbi:hypothetical protein EHO59_00290 [Leptospira semungkisensis]|uniref:Uncharacterized protein n=1 Tax=Leptospira semungkisensis TaxID=2484985 RepID=A0A4R9G758_9LEPT|nr:hypothetical protein [Leptospira semungkisensis]TGK06617.1 hypothetical protein EHO59_00290 [Leptospira semungkisensis]
MDQDASIELQILNNAVGVLAQFLTDIGFEKCNDLTWQDPSDASYLNEDDRQNMDIMANAFAMSETNRLIYWIGKDEDGFIGLWIGPSNIKLVDAPIVELDLEGQYRIIAVRLADYLLSRSISEDLDKNQELLTQFGFNVTDSLDNSDQALTEFREKFHLDSAMSPQFYRHQIYNDQRMQRGLEAIPFD